MNTSFKALTAQAHADIATLDAQGIDPWAPVEAPAPVSHLFGGIDGRCYDCDVRPGSRAAAEGCI